MGLMDSLIAGGALANGIVAFEAGTALWVMLILTLVGSGSGIVASIYQRRLRSLGLLRSPKERRLSPVPGQLCEAGSV